MSVHIFAAPDQREAKNKRISARDSRSNCRTKPSSPQQLSLSIAPTEPARIWAIAIIPIPPAEAIAPDRFWLTCNGWHYPLQFRADERKRLRALLLEYGSLDWAIDDQSGCPRCIGKLHEAIEAMINSPISGDREVRS